MKNQYHLKDKKIKIVVKTTTKDKYGQTVTVYKYLSNTALWAYARQLSQSQALEAKTYGDDETRLFVLNNRNDLKMYDFIEYEGKYYTITRLDTTDDYNTELFVYAKDTPKGDTPTNIQPADP